MNSKDHFPYLVDKNGSKLYTVLNPIKVTSKKSNQLKQEGWEFDWSIPAKDGFEVYELKANGSSDTLGMITLKHERGYTYVSNIESNPKNRGDNAEFKHTSYNLFAFAVTESVKNENGGCVSFKAKSRLIEFYAEKMGAQLISMQDMVIEGAASVELLKKYEEKL